MVIKKIFFLSNICRVVCTILLLVSMQNNTYANSSCITKSITISNQHSPDTMTLAWLFALNIGSFLTYFIYTQYKKNQTTMIEIKNIMLQNKAEIKKLFYNYPGIITFYKDIIMKENKIISTNFMELINIKKTFYSIVYEIMRILKADLSFHALEKEIFANKKLLEDVIKDIILNDPLFVETIL